MKVSSSIERYSLAMAICLGAIVLAWLTGAASCLLAAIVMACIYGGRGPGMVSIAICGLAFGIFLLFPGLYFPAHPNVLLRFAVFLASAVVVALFIQDHRSAEAARHAEHEARLIVESMPGLGWSTDAKGNFKYLNPSVFDYTGARCPDVERSDEQVNFGKEVLHPDEVDRVAEIWLHCLKTGDPYESEHRLRRFDGVYRWFRAAARPSRDRNGRVTGWYGMTLDIDDQKKAEEALRTSEQQLRLLIDTIPALVWCATPSGEPFYLNKRLLDYAGLSPEEAGQSRRKLIHPDDVSTLLRTWAQCVNTGQSFLITYRLRRADGVYRWHEGRSEPWRDQAGNIVQWYGVNVDIDERMRAEHELRSTQAQFLRASQLASLAELSASIAHEVNQPLAAVITNSHACQRWLAAEPPNLQRALLTTERIIRDANSAAEVVSKIRALFKQTALGRSAVDINQVIAEVCQLLGDEIAAKDVSVEAALEDNLPSILIDRVQMQQVLVNLIRNGIDALNATGEGSKSLVIRSRRDGTDKVRVEVQDYGRGVEDTERIFEPFFTTKEDGMGMGLAICRSIVEAHDGRLWATKGDPKGTALSFTLPSHPAALHTDDSA
jgi:PAS domain S-box-containing protein